MKVSRREFLKKAGSVGVGGSVVGLCSDRANGSMTRPVSDDWMGVLVDLTKCNGCRRCEAACREANGFEVLTDEELKDTSVFTQHRPLDPSNYTIVNEFPGRSDGDPSLPVYVKMNCLHCNDPACVSACIVGALRKEANGAVTYDPWKCMGCRYCMVACPFQIPTYEYDNALTPEVRKCTFCSNEGNPNRGGVPACVQACPKECLTYGKRSELLRKARERIRRQPDVYLDHVYGEHEAGGTSWLYLSGVPFEKIGLLEIGAKAPPRLAETIQHGVFAYFMPPVAWCAVLGLAMWLTRPDPQEPSPAAPPDDTSASRASAVPAKTTVRECEGVLA